MMGKNKRNQPALTTRLGDRFHDLFPALTHRNFRLFFFGQCVSLIGTWMQNIGQSWLVLQMTNSVFLLGLLTAVQFTPVMLLSLFGGTLADRMPKRKILVFTQTSLGILAALLALITVTGLVRYWMIMVLAGLLGAVNALDQPARQSFFVEIVGRDHLPNAITLNSSVFNLARLVGPAVAAVLINLVGISVCFFLNAASFIAVIIALTRIQMPVPERKFDLHGIHVRQTIADIGEGFRYIWKLPSLVIPLVTILGISVLIMNYNVALPAYSDNVIHEGVSGYGLLTTMMGIGSLLAALTLAVRLRRSPHMWLLTLSSLGISGLFLVLGLTSSYVFAAFLIFLTGMANITLTATTNSILQMTAKSEMRGRVMGVYSLVMGGTTPIGSLYTGAVSGAFGVPQYFWMSGGICLLLSLLAFLLFRIVRHREAAGRMAPT